MLRYIVRRVVYAIPILLIASVAVFGMVRATVSPLGVFAGDLRAQPEAIERYKQVHGLDRPPVEQYVTWLGNFVRGDWGASMITGKRVGPEMRTKLGNTLQLGLVALAVSLLFGIAIGTYSAVRQYSTFDQIATSTAFLGLSMPAFWFGLILQIVFGLYTASWFGFQLPVAGMRSPGTLGFDLWDSIRHMVLPVMTLSVQIIAVYSRYLRSSMLEVLNADYMRTARAKGLRERRVIMHHGMRNALIPLTTQVAIDIGALTGGLVVTEAIFQWPGMGTMFIQAMRLGDYAVVLPWLMVVVSAVIVLNLVADIAYAVLDPRIRHA